MVELVIRINKEVVEAFDKAKKENALNYYMNVYKDDLYNAIKNGTPLPKGHGKLKDVDKIEALLDLDKADNEIAKALKNIIDSVPTIIEAVKEDKEE